MSFSNNAVIAKAKAIYGNFLKASDYERLMKLRSIPDMVSFLKKHPNYAQTLKDVQENAIHRGQLESLIRKNAFNNILRLVKSVFTKDVLFYETNIVKLENDMLLTTLRAIISQQFDELTTHLNLFYNVHTRIPMEKLMAVRTFDDLISCVSKTPYETILKPFYTKNIEMIRYLDIEHALEVYYYDEAFKRIQKFYTGKTKQDLEDIYRTRIELGNITKIYRLKKFYNSDFITIKSVLLTKYSRMSDKKWDDLIQVKDPNAVLSYLSKSEFSAFKNDKDYVYVEYYAEKIRYHLARKFMYFSSNVPKVFTSFVTLSEIEIENITNIIEGIRYQIDESEMKQMLIY